MLEGCRGLVVVALSLAAASTAGAQTLSIQGDRFAVDGAPKFLTFISYFGAMNAGNVTADLRFIRSRGFDGVRIWPNVDLPLRLMNSDGALSPDGLSRLMFILDRARDERLVVDVTFTAEHVAGLDPRHYRDGILSTTAELKRYDNLIFDIENERNIYGPLDNPLSSGDVAAIFAGIKAIQPDRIATASNSSLVTAEYAANFTGELGLDVTAYHDPREWGWFQLDTLQPLVRTLRANGRPAYLQEPMPTRDPRFSYYPQHDRADYFLQAVANAKLAGAAAWCFHTDVGQDLRGSSTFIEDKLRALPEPEWTFVNSLVPARINLQTSNGRNYIMAEGGGGGDVRAASTSAGAWENFSVLVLAGGPAVDGDRVAIASSDGTHYLQAVGGGGAALRAVGERVGPWETFIIEKPGGGGIRPGDGVRLRAAGAPWYTVAEGGGGGSVNVNRASPGLWETFTIVFVR